MSPPRSRDLAACQPTRAALPADAPAAANCSDKAPEAARQRLLHAGLRLFAQHGFAGTTTRELADAAQVNVAAISYYFGDKAGLYRAAFVEPFGDDAHLIGCLGAPELPLRAALQVYYAGFVEPLRAGEVAEQCMRLHLREMLEPTGMWQAEIENSIKPTHEALVQLLARHIGVAIDLELHRLGHSLAAMAIYLHVGRDVIQALQPELNTAEGAHDLWVERLADFGVAMVEAERQRRTRQALDTSQPGTDTP